MNDPLRSGSGPESCGDSEIRKLIREAREELDRAQSLPPRQIGKEIDRAEVRIARLRDCLIDRLRGEEGPGEARWRSALGRVNVALSFVVGVEYPATGIHRNLLEEAGKVLAGLEGREAA